MKYVGYILGFGVVVAYVPNVTGTAALTGWAFLAGLLPFFMWRRIAGPVSPLHWLGLGFIAWAGLSLLWTENIYDGLGSFALWIILGMAFHLGSTTLDALPIYRGICVGVSLCVVVAIAQSLGWRGIYVQEEFTSNVPSIFVNSTVFGTVCALALVLGIFGNLWWSIPASALGLFLSGARGPAIAVIIVILSGVWRNWSRGTAILLLVPALLFGAGVFVNKSKNLSDLEGSTKTRVAYWFDSIEAFKLPGYGVGSFFQVFPSVAKRADTLKLRPEHPYSDPIELVFEFGLGAVLLFWLALLALEIPLEPDRSILLAFLISGLGYPNLAIPLVAFLAAFASGRLAHGWSLVRCGEQFGRPQLPHWMGVEGYGAARACSQSIPIQSDNPN